MAKACKVFGDMVWQICFLMPLAFCIFLCWGARPREARPTFLWRFVSSNMTKMSEHVLKFSWLISHGGGGFWSLLKQHLPEVNKLIQILVNPDFANLRVLPLALCVNDTTVYKGFPLRNLRWLFCKPPACGLSTSKRPSWNSTFFIPEGWPRPNVFVNDHSQTFLLTEWVSSFCCSFGPHGILN